MDQTGTTHARKTFILKQDKDGTPVPETCRKAGISQATYFKSRNKYGGLARQHQENL